MATVSPDSPKKRRPKFRFSLRRRVPRVSAPYWAKPWVIGGALTALLVLWLLPTLLGHTSLVTRIARQVGADVNGRIDVQSASLGWFSPVRLYGVRIVDQDDRPVIDVPEIRGERALMSLLWNKSDPGAFHLDGPKLSVVLREDGSNLEDVFAKYLAPSDRKKIGVAVEVVNGSVSIEDSRSRKNWQIDQLDVSFAMPADRSRPWELTTSGILAGAQRGGSFNAEMRVQQPVGDRTPSGTKSAGAQEAEGPAGPDLLTLKTEGLNLAVLEPVMRRAVPGMRLAGRLSAVAECRWDSRRPDSRAAVRMSTVAEDLKLAAAILGTDQPSLARLRVDGAMEWENGLVQFDRVTADSDIGSLSLTGVVDISGRARAAARRGYEVSGQLDLARLAALLPNTLKIQKDTRITSGQAQLTFANRPGQEGAVLNGRLEFSNLTANSGGRQVAWKQPISLALAAKETAQGPVIETFKCESTFLRMQVSGTPSQLTGTATFDAGKLAEQSRGFVDLGGTRLAGDGSAELTWKRTADGAFDANAKLRLNGFQFALPERPAWTEDALSLTVSATGQSNASGPTRLNTAVVKMESGSDLVETRLLEPVADFRGSGPWQVELHSRGQLTRWPGRLAWWLPSKTWSAQGSYDLVAGATLSGTALAIRQARLTAQTLEIAGPKVVAREPRLEMSLTGRCDWASRRLELENATLASSTIAVQATRFICSLPPRGPVELTGSLVGQAALDRVRALATLDAKAPPAWSLGGRLVGRAEFKQSGGLVTGHVDGQITDLDIVHKSGQRFQDRDVRFVAQGNYNDASRLVHIEQAEFTSATLKCSLAGKIAELNTQPDLQLSGRIDYDMERLSLFVRSLVGEGFRLAGRGSSPIAYQGVWGSDKAVATGKLGWSWAQVYGFQLGAGELQASLTKGLLDVQPLTVDCNEGRLRVAPQFKFAQEPREIAIAPGRVVDQVRLTPAMCTSLLQYIAPLLAGVTTAEGRFSIDLEGFRVPLWTPTAAAGAVVYAPLNWPEAEIAGKLVVHSAQISPGYLIREIAQLLGYNNPAYLMRESAIPFRMTKGRIYHQQMDLALGDLTIRTYGSVGLDQSLSLKIEMPIPPKWQSQAVIGSVLKNQTITLPVVGYLHQPKIDHTAFDQLAKQFLQNATQNVMKNRISGQLDKLIGPLQKR